MKKAICIVFSLFAVLQSCEKENKSDRLVVKLTDSTGYYEAVHVDIREVQIQGNEGSERPWISLPHLTQGVYKLPDAAGGPAAAVSGSKYSLDKMNQIRLVLGDKNSVTVGGVSYPLTTRDTIASGLKLQLQTMLTRDLTYAVLLDFDATTATPETDVPQYILKPVLKVALETLDGIISGQVIPAELDVTVYAIAGPDTVATYNVPAGTSEFLLAGLPTSNYTIVFDPGRSSGYDVIELENIPVNLIAISDAGTAVLEDH